MLYGRSDIQCLTVGETGHTHERPKGHVGPFPLDCPECEPLMTLRDAPWWSTTPQTAPMTEAEQEGVEEQRQNVLAAVLEDPLAFMEFVQQRKAGLAAGPPSRKPRVIHTAPRA